MKIKTRYGMLNVKIKLRNNERKTVGNDKVFEGREKKNNSLE